jgi:serine/threonine-protein kinase
MEQTTPPPKTTQEGDSGDPMKGRVLAGTYRLRRLLGEGGMGKVYEAGHVRLSKKRYAVKVLQASAADDAEAYARFKREAEIATEIGHSHIVEVHDFNVTEEGQPFMVMEFLEGQDLFDYAAHRRLERHEVTRVLRQVAAALAAAHGRGIVHRDLKPENIFLTRNEDGDIHVKLLDFGLSKIKHGRSRLTKQNAVFGTPNYMSPEQANGQVEDIDHRTDIFALGVIAYQCLSGVMPFDGPTPLGILYKVCNEDFKPLTELMPGLSDEVDAVMDRVMAKERQDRHKSAQEFVQELMRALERTERRPSGRRISVEDKTPLFSTSAAGKIDRETPTPAVSRSRPPATEPPASMSRRASPRQSLLPPGAPPLPDDALPDTIPPMDEEAETLPLVDTLPPVDEEEEVETLPPKEPPPKDGPSVVVSPSLAPNALQLPPGGLRREQQVASIHEIETGEVDPLPQTTELPSLDASQLTDEFAPPELRAQPVAKQRMIALLVLVAALTVIGVVTTLVTIHVAGPTTVRVDGALLVPDLPPPPDQAAPDMAMDQGARGRPASPRPADEL